MTDENMIVIFNGDEEQVVFRLIHVARRQDAV